MAIVGDGKLGLLCAWASRLDGSPDHAHRQASFDKLALAGDRESGQFTSTTSAPARAPVRRRRRLHGLPLGPRDQGARAGPKTTWGPIVLKTTVAGDPRPSTSPRS